MRQQTRDKIEIFLGSVIVIMLSIIGVFMMRVLDKVENTHDTVIRLETEMKLLQNERQFTRNEQPRR